MFNFFLIVILFNALLRISGEEVDLNKRKGRDSYLDALTESHGPSPSEPDNRDYTTVVQGFPYPDPTREEVEYSSRPQYGPPSAPPKIIYGPPTYPSPAPAPQYGPPSYVYGPPSPQVTYAPPQPFYGVPYAFLGILDKIKYKLDLFTIGKIILKLVIFKKLISFIAILCLLLFIPTLKQDKPDNSNENDNDTMRNLQGDQSLDNLSNYVREAIQSFSQSNKSKTCKNVFCKTNELARKLDKKLTYKKLKQLSQRDD